MNYALRAILACGQEGFCGGVHAALPNKDADLWPEHSSGDDEALPSIPRVIRLTLERLNDQEDEQDDEYLRGLAFVDETNARNDGTKLAPFEEFLEMEDSIHDDDYYDDDDTSFKAERLIAWHTSYLSLSEHGGSLIGSRYDDGSSYDSMDSSDLFFAQVEQDTELFTAFSQTSPLRKSSRSQVTVTTSSSYTTRQLNTK